MVFKVYIDSDNRWRWMLLHSDRTIIAISAASFAGWRECIVAISTLKYNIPVASVIEDETVKQYAL